MAQLGLYGQLGVLNPDIEKISTYLQKIRLYMEANEVVDEKRSLCC